MICNEALFFGSDMDVAVKVTCWLLVRRVVGGL